MLIDRLIADIIKKQAPIVVGLDPRLEMIPKVIIDEAIKKYGKTVEAASYAIFIFNAGIIDAVVDLVPAIKPQIAFYEALGLHGLKAYNRTCEYAHKKGLIVIADTKRGDIGSTSKAYADAYIGSTSIFENSYKPFYSDFVTVNPYLGTDCLAEFVNNIDQYDTGIFALVKTSNPSSGELQDLVVDDMTIYQKVADIVEVLSAARTGQYGYSSIGSVIGATYPEQAEALRTHLTTSFFLVPGYGAQGGSGADVVPCFDQNGLGAIVNSSRGITYAYLNDSFSDDFREAAKQAVIQMRDDINENLKVAGKWYGDFSLNKEISSDIDSLDKLDDESKADNDLTVEESNDDEAIF